MLPGTKLSGFPWIWAGLPLATCGLYDSPGNKAQKAIHDQAKVHLKRDVTSRDGQKGRQQKVGCIAGKNSCQGLHEIGCHF
jgi:hypothetical protein